MVAARSVATTQLHDSYNVPSEQLCAVLLAHQQELEAAGHYKGAAEVERHMHTIKRQEASRRLTDQRAAQLEEVEAAEMHHGEAFEALQLQWDAKALSVAQRHGDEREGLAERHTAEAGGFRQVLLPPSHVLVTSRAEQSQSHWPLPRGVNTMETPCRRCVKAPQTQA